MTSNTPQVNAQERLLTAATEAFARDGYHATTTRDIAARAGMSPAAVYVHHDSKESLLFEVSNAGHVEVLRTVQEAAKKADNPPDRLCHVVYDFTRWHAENAQLARVVQYEFRALTEEHRRVIGNLRREIEAVLIEIVQAGVANGDFTAQQIFEVSRAILSLGVDVVRWFDPGRSAKGKEIAELYAALALKMVGHKSAEA